MGKARLKFALVSPDGNVTHWSQDGTSVSGSEPGEHVSVQVRGGLYSILLGNTSIPGMDAMNPSLFQQISDLHLRVWFSDGVNGFERISPDRPFASVPYAMSADIGPGTITSTQLNEQILKYLRPEVVRSPSFHKTGSRYTPGSPSPSRPMPKESTSPTNGCLMGRRFPERPTRNSLFPMPMPPRTTATTVCVSAMILAMCPPPLYNWMSMILNLSMKRISMRA